MEELNLGKKLQAIRTSKKISVRKLAAMTNLTASMISQIENGAVNPSIPTLRTISSALETPIYYFFQRRRQCLCRRHPEHPYGAGQQAGAFRRVRTADTGHPRRD